jgi:murein DD-endopeptidase MepM/ murein hydrolase activator NlpD
VYKAGKKIKKKRKIKISTITVLTFLFFLSCSKVISSYNTPINCAYRVSRDFSVRAKHFGIDLATQRDCPVKSVWEGRVIFAGYLKGYGLTVVIRHASVATLYAHLSKIDVKAGQKILANQRIGAVGESGNATGPHLHFEVLIPSTKAWRAWKRVNPRNYIRL